MNKKIKREITEWTVFLLVAGTLYFTGLHTEVIGFMQRGVLATGLFSPKTVTDNHTIVDFDWQLTDLDGEQVSFGDFKGKTIFINFWATWCPPCIAEMPDIQKLSNALQNEVVFLIVSLDEDPGKAHDFIAKKGFDLPIYFPTSSIPAAMRGNSIPRTYVVAPNGRIVSETHGMAKYNSEKFRDFILSL